MPKLKVLSVIKEQYVLEATNKPQRRHKLYNGSYKEGTNYIMEATKKLQNTLKESKNCKLNFPANKFFKFSDIGGIFQNCYYLI